MKFVGMSAFVKRSRRRRLLCRGHRSRRKHGCEIPHQNLTEVTFVRRFNGRSVSGTIQSIRRPEFSSLPNFGMRISEKRHFGGASSCRRIVVVVVRLRGLYRTHLRVRDSPFRFQWVRMDITIIWPEYAEEISSIRRAYRIIERIDLLGLRPIDQDIQTHHHRCNVD